MINVDGEKLVNLNVLENKARKKIRKNVFFLRRYSVVLCFIIERFLLLSRNNCFTISPENMRVNYNNVIPIQHST